jgi:uncharacterized membrane protein HdeD (DUF308 family)
MATTLNHPHRHHHVMTTRSSLQKLCIGMGLFFLLMGVIGMVVPGFFGLHLSSANNLVHIVSGVLALWCGYSEKNSRAYNFCLALGTLYLILGVAGFVVGEPGYPSVGYTRADEFLFRLIPNGLEFGTMDHIAHLVVSAILFGGAYSYRREVRTDKERLVVDVQARTGIFHRDTVYPTDSTGTIEISASDIDRIQKMRSGNDFERRV